MHSQWQLCTAIFSAEALIHTIYLIGLEIIVFHMNNFMDIIAAIQKILMLQ